MGFMSDRHEVSLDKCEKNEVGQAGVVSELRREAPEFVPLRGMIMTTICLVLRVVLAVRTFLLLRTFLVLRNFLVLRIFSGVLLIFLVVRIFDQVVGIFLVLRFFLSVWVFQVLLTFLFVRMFFLVLRIFLVVLILSGVSRIIIDARIFSVLRVFSEVLLILRIFDQAAVIFLVLRFFLVVPVFLVLRSFLFVRMFFLLFVPILMRSSFVPFLLTSFVPFDSWQRNNCRLASPCGDADQCDCECEPIECPTGEPAAEPDDVKDLWKAAAFGGMCLGVWYDDDDDDDVWHARLLIYPRVGKWRFLTPDLDSCEKDVSCQDDQDGPSWSIVLDDARQDCSGPEWKCSACGCQEWYWNSVAEKRCHVCGHTSTARSQAEATSAALERPAAAASSELSECAALPLKSAALAAIAGGRDDDNDDEDPPLARPAALGSRPHGARAASPGRLRVAAVPKKRALPAGHAQAKLARVAQAAGAAQSAQQPSTAAATQPPSVAPAAGGRPRTQPPAPAQPPGATLAAAARPPAVTPPRGAAAPSTEDFPAPSTRLVGCAAADRTRPSGVQPSVASAARPPCQALGEQHRAPGDLLAAAQRPAPRPVVASPARARPTVVAPREKPAAGAPAMPPPAAARAQQPGQAPGTLQPGQALAAAAVEERRAAEQPREERRAVEEKERRRAAEREERLAAEEGRGEEEQSAPAAELGSGGPRGLCRAEGRGAGGQGALQDGPDWARRPTGTALPKQPPPVNPPRAAAQRPPRFFAVPCLGRGPRSGPPGATLKKCPGPAPKTPPRSPPKAQAVPPVPPTPPSGSVSAAASSKAAMAASVAEEWGELARRLARGAAGGARAGAGSGKDKLGIVDFPMPQFILLGKQSVGKSRLIEALAGETFNFVSGTLGSRRPTVLEFRNVAGAGASKWFVRDKATNQWDEHTVAEVMVKIGQAHEELGETVSTDPCWVRIESPGCVDMQIVDLPGFRDFSIDDSKKELSRKIEELNKGFMSDARNVMLCVAAGGLASGAVRRPRGRSTRSHEVALVGTLGLEQPWPSRMGPKKPPSGHSKQRAAWSQPWYCRFCWAPSGERWWNHVDLLACKKCQRSKGQCFHSNRVPHEPSVSTQGKAAAAEMRKLQAELKEAKSELVQARAEAKEGKAATATKPDPFGMDVDSSMAQLGAEVAALREKHAAELAQLRAKQMGQKPLPVQMQRLSQQITGLERKAEGKREVMAKLLGQLRELQAQHDEAAASLGSIQSEIAVLEAQRTEVAVQFPQPTTVVEGVKASLDSVLPSVQMSVEQMVQVLGTFGADEETARDLHRAAGRVREAAVKAQAERQAELERQQAEAARAAGPPAGGAAPGTPEPAVAPPAATRGFRLPAAAGVGAVSPGVLKAFLQAMGQTVPPD
ncbi:unnamed protein product [Prorocentrum cordatum]|uniref:Dynamin N-terminal domain-containing protein n=1 Tax=Prorocentrum cordatum TaxID=2364126 RepID=A0ABN9UDD0_9DINO|nr:unnamed protein product [Polarella glacialis]